MTQYKDHVILGAITGVIGFMIGAGWLNARTDASAPKAERANGKLIGIAVSDGGVYRAWSDGTVERYVFWENMMTGVEDEGRPNWERLQE